MTKMQLFKALNQWADVYFLGGNGLTIWNARIITAANEFWETVEEMAHNRIREMLSPEEQHTALRKTEHNAGHIDLMD